MKPLLPVTLFVALSFSCAALADEPATKANQSKQPPSQVQIEQWVKNLSDDSHELGEPTALFKAGEAAVPKVVKALEDKNEYVRHWANHIVRQWVESDDHLAIRALENRVPMLVQEYRDSPAYWFRKRGFMAEVDGEGRLGLMTICNVKELPRDDFHAAMRLLSKEIHAAIRQLKEVDDETEIYIHTIAPFGDAHIAGLQGLKTLKGLFIDARKTDVTDAGLAQLRDLDSLELLTIEQADITDAGLASLANLSVLKKLEITYTNIGDEGLRHLCNLKHLTFLNLWMTRISDDTVALIAKLESLESLQLHLSKATDADVARIKKLKPLTHLTIRDHNISDDGIAALRALPNCEVVLGEAMAAPSVLGSP